MGIYLFGLCLSSSGVLKFDALTLLFLRFHLAFLTNYSYFHPYCSCIYCFTLMMYMMSILFKEKWEFVDKNMKMI